MELISSIALLFFLSFLYSLGLRKEDSILELIGITMLIILGILWFSTGMQFAQISSDGNLYFVTIPGGDVVGIFIVFTAVLLGFYGWKTITEMKKIKENEG